MSTPWPNLFVAGAAKAGTTTLWGALDAHPEIWMSQIKEPHFFSSWQPSGQPRLESDEEYLRLFAKGAGLRYRGEASPGYFSQEGSVQAIREACPDARIVLSLREPVARAHSAYLHKQRRHAGIGSFANAISAELAGGGWKDVVDPGRYGVHVARWFETFGREHVHVLFFEDLVGDPTKTSRALLRFLELDESPQLVFERRNEFLIPSNRVSALVLRPRVRRAARAVVPLGLRERGERLLGREAAKPAIEPEARALLEEAYVTERERLEQLLGRKAPW